MKYGRLIDGDAFRRELDYHWPFTKEEQSKHGIADFAKSAVLMVLNQMPTIEPERKKGKWIEDDDGWDGVLWRCSECAELFYLVDGTPEENEYHYCPFCGADMMEGEKE